MMPLQEETIIMIRMGCSSRKPQKQPEQEKLLQAATTLLSTAGDADVLS